MKYLSYLLITALGSTQSKLIAFEKSCHTDKMGCDFNSELECLDDLVDT